MGGSPMAGQGQECDKMRARIQNVNLTPTWAAKGMPTVVPGPKKSPRAPAGTRSCLKLVIGTAQAEVGHRAVAFVRSLTGVGRAEMSVT